MLLIVTFVTLSLVYAQDGMISFGKSSSLEKALFKTKEKESAFVMEECQHCS